MYITLHSQRLWTETKSHLRNFIVVNIGYFLRRYLESVFHCSIYIPSSIYEDTLTCIQDDGLTLLNTYYIQPSYTRQGELNLGQRDD